MQLSQVVREECLRRAAESQAQRVRGDMWISVTIPADPATGPQEACRAPAEKTLPPGIEPRHDGKKHIPQICEGNINFIRNVEPLPSQRAGLPKQGNLSRDALL